MAEYGFQKQEEIGLSLSTAKPYFARVVLYRVPGGNPGEVKESSRYTAEPV
jgi:hypothetical protein